MLLQRQEKSVVKAQAKLIAYKKQHLNAAADNDVELWVEITVKILDFGVVTKCKSKKLKEERVEMWILHVEELIKMGSLNYGTTLHRGMRWLMKLAATSAFGFPTSECLF